ncbi:MAG: hypothetical protein M0P91_11135 [Sulfuricurvum sp.]|jgi:hypothetical protein|uniref:hypothetical protein n=1 Tax=Sulfuricurvum sp. TaxID=2025608 RepID=UPI0025CBA9A0|nr:hypothetical protein [Sulfuricurvum sp.]MCK9373744.1 hypothetical protein [Sulfuricurvum sp.]
MAFILRFADASHQLLYPRYLGALARKVRINARIIKEKNSVVCALDERSGALESFMEILSSSAPSSIFLGSVTHAFDDEAVDEQSGAQRALPLGLGLCPSCTREMLDPAGARYYYPFTSCNHCGGQYAFFEHYPYIRENTRLSSHSACPSCEEEAKEAGFREGYPQISCNECPIPVRFEGMSARSSVEYRRLFKHAAHLISQGKKVSIKSTLGKRRYELCTREAETLMICDMTKITDYLAVIDEELNALTAIERPILHTALKDEALQQILGESRDVKCPDDGFALLLARELREAGIGVVSYTENFEGYDAEMTFDPETNVQSDLHLFVNKEVRFIQKGERVSFPAHFPAAHPTLSVAHGLVYVAQGGGELIDQTGRFASAAGSRLSVLEGEPFELNHSNRRDFSQDEGSFMAVLAEHDALSCSAVGVHFDESISFLYYNGKRLVRAVPSITFHHASLIESLKRLREGSERLVENCRHKRPEVFAALEKIESAPCSVFEAAAMIIGLDHPSLDALMRESLRFNGKGGTQIDIKSTDSRFDPVVFLASILSYVLADVPKSLLCYSIFESLGDYFGDILTELKQRSKAQETVICGAAIANQSLYSRMMRNLKNTSPLAARSFPIGRENGVIGGIYL